MKSIWCDSQIKDERKRNGQKRAAMSHISGYVLDIYLTMRSDSKHKHQIYPIPIPSLFLNIFVASAYERIFV